MNLKGKNVLLTGIASNRSLSFAIANEIDLLLAIPVTKTFFPFRFII